MRIMEETKPLLAITRILDIVNNVHPTISSQNCQLCASCFELQMRGIQIIPREVLSSRDIIFKDRRWKFLKDPKDIKLPAHRTKEFIINTIQKAGNGSRFYAMVKWNGDNGGHVFNLINIHNMVFIVDCQADKVIELSQDNYYFNNIDCSDSVIIRTDNLDIDELSIRYNKDKFTAKWHDGDENLLYLTEGYIKYQNN